MRRTIDLLLLAAAMLAAVIAWRLQEEKLRAAARTFMNRALPCSSPVTLSVGSLDPLHKISKEEVSVSLRAAEAAWEAAAGRDLFVILPEGGDVTVSLVYDERQAALDKLRAIGLDTDRTLAAYKSLKERHDSILAGLKRRKEEMEARLASYRRGEGAYNATIAEYNRRNLVSEDDQRRLNAARAALEREFAAIKRQEKEVNSETDLYNALSTTLNQLIVDLKLNVEQYSHEGAALGMFEEGVYRVSGGARSIYIYRYYDGGQLSQLLAHEMGHALGLDHAGDPRALMAPVNRVGSLEFRPADLAELDRACMPLGRRLKEDWRSLGRSLLRGALDTLKGFAGTPGKK